MFNEMCIYEVKIEKQDEIEELMREAVDFYRKQPGMIEVRYVKRTYKERDLSAVKNGERPKKLTRQVGKVIYVCHLAAEDEDAHAKATRLGAQRFYSRLNNCLITMPKSFLGEDIA